ncbi:transcriptional regulator/antitoxin MazE [Klebsiella pneumoniae]|uniref:Transcriptional regulator/antitoxin MazE n=1 Tax=Klebsiella pneumoniae TaxID=573 RepID=A0A2X3H488_KLEPN|nr:transcriptional regulator/antitoxin MazE [Klebsiella pneumoniae]
MLKTLELSTDSEVGMTIDNGCLIIEPRNGPVIRLRSCWRSAIRTPK